MYFQLVDNQALSTQGQPDGGVNLHRLTEVLQHKLDDEDRAEDCLGGVGDPGGALEVGRRRLNTSG